MVTPFDIYATLQHVMNVPLSEKMVPKAAHQTSLFERISGSYDIVCLLMYIIREQDLSASKNTCSLVHVSTVD
jgi:hypothetical protein